jgi:hypothetical protein
MSGMALAAGSVFPATPAAGVNAARYSGTTINTAFQS